MGRDTNTGATGGATTGTQAVTRAQTLITEINQHIRNRDFDQAEEKLDELESMKSQLPPSVQTQIESLRKSFDAQKSGAGVGTTPPSSPATPSTPPPTNPDE